MNMKKKILFIKPYKVRDHVDLADWNGIENTIKSIEGEPYEVEITDYDELAYLADGNNSKIWNVDKKYDIADFDLVVIRRVGDNFEKAVSIAHYLDYKNVKFIDSFLRTQGKGKLAGAFLRSANNIPVPLTFSGNAQVFEKVFSSNDCPISFPIILKADEGRKGHDNYLVNDLPQLMNILNENLDILFVAQPFIDNDGDFRVLVLNYTPRLAIKRTRQSGTHLNNTSQGGAAILTDIAEFDDLILQDCIKAAQLDELEVAGVDVLIDKNTGKHYFLEVNRTPQLATGALTEYKMAAYKDMIIELVDSSGGR